MTCLITSVATRLAKSSQFSSFSFWCALDHFLEGVRNDHVNECGNAMENVAERDFLVRKHGAYRDALLTPQCFIALCTVRLWFNDSA